MNLGPRWSHAGLEKTRVMGQGSPFRAAPTLAFQRCLCASTISLAPIWLASCWPMASLQGACRLWSLVLGQSSPDFTRDLCICPVNSGPACLPASSPRPLHSCLWGCLEGPWLQLTLRPPSLLQEQQLQPTCLAALGWIIPEGVTSPGPGSLGENAPL